LEKYPAERVPAADKLLAMVRRYSSSKNGGDEHKFDAKSHSIYSMECQDEINKYDRCMHGAKGDSDKCIMEFVENQRCKTAFYFAQHLNETMNKEAAAIKAKLKKQQQAANSNKNKASSSEESSDSATTLTEEQLGLFSNDERALLAKVMNDNMFHAEVAIRIASIMQMASDAANALKDEPDLSKESITKQCDIKREEYKVCMKQEKHHDTEKCSELKYVYENCYRTANWYVITL